VPIEQGKGQLRKEITLAELPRAFSLTQETLAKKLNVKQAEISKVENRDDMLTVTARKDGTSWLPIRLPEPMVHGDLILVPLLVH